MCAELDARRTGLQADIATLRQKVTDVFPTDQPDFYDDLFVMRFVMTHSKGGTTCKMGEAEDALRKTLAWRKQHSELLQRTWETGKAPNEEVCKKFNTVGYAGDLGGLEPIFVVRTGHCNTKGLMNSLPQEKVTDWLHFSREIAFRLCDEKTRKTRKMIKNITIIDLAGWSLFAGDSRFEKCLQKASELSAIYYPQLLGKTVILNMPGFFKSIFKASMSLMPASLKDKIAICPQVMATQNLCDDSMQWPHSRLLCGCLTRCVLIQSDTETCGKDVTGCPFFQRFDGTNVNVPKFLGGTKECPEQLLPRAECEASLTKVTVSAGKATSIDFDVPMMTSASWEVVVEDFGINMTVTFVPDVNPEDKWMNPNYTPQYGQEAVVFPTRKIKAVNGLASGMISLPSKGKITVKFDNSYSWFRSKTFDYHIKVSDGGSPSEDADNGHTATKLTGDSETWDVLGIKEEADNIMYNLGQGLGLGK